MLRMAHSDAEVRKQWHREYYLRNREKLLQRQREYAATHKPERKAYVNANRDKIRALLRKASRKRWLLKPDYLRAKQKAYTRRLKEQMIAAYGGCCKCCGEDRYEFLTIDHVYGGGNKHRKSLHGRHGTGGFYKMLRDQGWPQAEYRLLCLNCNFSYGHYGYCPHREEVNEQVA